MRLNRCCCLLALINGAGRDRLLHHCCIVRIRCRNTHYCRTRARIVLALIHNGTLDLTTVLIHHFYKSCLITDVRAGHAHITDHLTAVCNDGLILRRIFGEHFTLKLHSPARISGLHTIYIECDLLVVGITFNIDGMLRIVDKTEILTGRFRDRRIRRFIYIGNHHGVIVTLRHLQFRTKHCII